MRHIAYALLLGLSLAFVAPVSARAQHFPADEDLRLILRYLVEDGETPGIVLGVLEADGSTRILSYGSGGSDTRPLGPRSVFDIGSLNKTFTAALLADMVARGEVALQDPVASYLPDSVGIPSLEGREITLLDLATHTSGLPRMPDNYRPPDMWNPYADYSVETLYSFLSGHRLRRRPGAEYEYSNLGYGLLGHALARAAGMTYRDLLRERVLTPLGMDQTEYGIEGELGQWMVWGHRYGEAVPYWQTTEAIEGAGGLRSSAEDMLTYLKANVGPPATALERAMRVAHEVRGIRGESGPEYGFSWTVQTAQGSPPIVMHGGATGGFTARLAFIQEEGIGIVWMANASGVAANLEDLLLFDPAPAEWGKARVDPEVLTSYTGKYESASGNSTYYIRLEEDGYLTYQPRGLSRARLYAKSDTTFYILQGPWSFTFRTGGAEGGVEMVGDVDEREPGLELQRVARKVGSDTPRPAVVAGNAGMRVALIGFTEPIAWVVYGWGPVAWFLLGLMIVFGVVMLGWRFLRWRRRPKAHSA